MNDFARRLIFPVILTVTAPVGAAGPTPSQMTVEQGELQYHACLNDEFGNMLKASLDDANIYPLIAIRDEDLAAVLTARCSAARAKTLSNAADPEAMGRMLDDIQQLTQGFVAAAQLRRPALEAKAEEIHVAGPRPAVPLSEAIAVDDYPARAQRKREQGTATAKYTVGVDGRVSKCTATGASNALNESTCEIILRRWRYAPAIDGNNRPIAEVRLKRVAWFMN
ncbi:MAG: energy transducer TonB [Sphingobium sp.]|nr:energy transducer TonB [Sphingobium sp.]